MTAIKDLDDVEDPGKQFRFKNKKVHLTYKQHLDAKDFLEYMTLKVNNNIVEWSICHEMGETDYAHTHIYLAFEKAIDTTNARFFDIGEIHPNIKKVKTNAHVVNILNYHKKEGKCETNITKMPVIKANAKSQSDETDVTVTNALKYENVSEAMTGVNNLKLVASIELAFKYKRMDFGPEPTNTYWRKWQKELLAELEGPAHRRKILWYHDPTGDSGKSVLAEHLFIHRKDVLVLTHATPRDAATTIQTAQQMGLVLKTIILDLTRSDAKYIASAELYRALEEFKNGLITSTKYVGKTTALGRLHVVVFSNHRPCKKIPVKEHIMDDNDACVGSRKIMIDTMSKDKWDIRTLGTVTQKDNRVVWDVVNRESYESPEEEIPEGYVMPGLAGLKL